MEQRTEQHALKEWAVAVEALARGETILLLRKGGIREEGKHFRVAHDEVLLYPTYEHQQPELLKPAYAAQVTPVPAGWHPAEVPISAWARITHIFQVRARETVDALLPYHIWNERFAAERFGWKPRFPLWLLLLRVYRLPAPRMIAYRPEYGGCKSWIDLHEPVALAGLQPALDDAAYARLVDEIRAIAEREQTVGV